MENSEEIVKQNVKRVETPDYMRTRIFAAIEKAQEAFVSKPKLVFASLTFICLVCLSIYSSTFSATNSAQITEANETQAIGEDLFVSNQLYND